MGTLGASFLAIVVALALGCDKSTTGTGAEARSGQMRVTAPVVSAADAQQVATDNRAFALDLYGVLRTGPSANLVVSPASISIALAMLYGGTAGGTATEVASALHFGLSPEQLHPAFDALDLALNAPPSSSAGAGAGAFQLKVANALWGQSGFTLLPTYLDLLAVNYGAGLRVLDFAGAPEPSRLDINAWVAAATANKIPHLLPQGSIDPSTRLVLTNAVYFLADWLMPFMAKSPDGTFHAPGHDVTTKMMSGPKIISLWTGTRYSAARLPYVGGTTSMVLVVPDAGTFDTFEQGLTGDGLGAIFDAGNAASFGALTMPAFSVNTATSLKRALGALGMQAAFVPVVADLSAIDGAHDLFVSDVVHQATITVNEKGTEAAAATGVVVSTASATLNNLFVDRPFLFFIRHDPTGAILFEGRVTDPTSPM